MYDHLRIVVEAAAWGEVPQMAGHPIPAIRRLAEEGYVEIRDRRGMHEFYGLTERGIAELNGVTDLNRYRRQTRELETFREAADSNGVVSVQTGTLPEKIIQRLVDEGLVQDLRTRPSGMVGDDYHDYVLSMKGPQRRSH